MVVTSMFQQQNSLFFFSTAFFFIAQSDFDLGKLGILHSALKEFSGLNLNYHCVNVSLICLTNTTNIHTDSNV